MTVTANPTTAQLRFLTALIEAGGTSADAMKLVGSWEPIKRCVAAEWAAEEPLDGGHPGQIQHRILDAGRRAAGRADTTTPAADPAPRYHSDSRLPVLPVVEYEDDTERPAPGTPEGDALLTHEQRAKAGWVSDQGEIDRLLDDAIGPQPTALVATTPSVFPDAPAVRQSGDGSQEFGPYVTGPRFPEGTPEHDAYAAELRTELGKFSRGEAPYGMGHAIPGGRPEHRVPAVRLTTPRPVEPAPTSVRVDGRDVVIADAALVELVMICRDKTADAQHMNPQGSPYGRARQASDAALDEIKRRVDTLYRAANALGRGSSLDEVLVVLDAAERRPAAGPPST